MFILKQCRIPLTIFVPPVRMNWAARIEANSGRLLLLLLLLQMSIMSLSIRT